MVVLFMVLKDDTINQTMLVPMDLSNLIPEGHPLEHHLGGLRGHGGGALADGPVELVGTARLEQVVLAMQATIGPAGLGVGEGQAPDIHPFCILSREIAGRIRHENKLG